MAWQVQTAGTGRNCQCRRGRGGRRLHGLGRRAGLRRLGRQGRRQRCRHRRCHGRCRVRRRVEGRLQCVGGLLGLGKVERAARCRDAVEEAGPDVGADASVASPGVARDDDDLPNGLRIAVVHVDLHLLPQTEVDDLDEFVHVSEHHLRGAQQVVLIWDETGLLGGRVGEDIQDTGSLIVSVVERIIPNHSSQEACTAPSPRHDVDVTRRVRPDVVHDEPGSDVLGLLNLLEEGILVRVHPRPTNIHDEIEEDLQTCLEGGASRIYLENAEPSNFSCGLSGTHGSDDPPGNKVNGGCKGLPEPMAGARLE
mmetsp:Transcript_7176/g.22988  ORF Transcript_7176/g.22988 Transcript_7176/m.22988 type:complete len:310 (-) Transcript_7176:8-937(-)